MSRWLLTHFLRRERDGRMAIGFGLVVLLVFIPFSVLLAVTLKHGGLSNLFTTARPPIKQRTQPSRTTEGTRSPFHFDYRDGAPLSEEVEKHIIYRKRPAEPEDDK